MILDMLRWGAGKKRLGTTGVNGFFFLDAFYIWSKDVDSVALRNLSFHFILSYVFI